MSDIAPTRSTDSKCNIPPGVEGGTTLEPAVTYSRTSRLYGGAATMVVIIVYRGRSIGIQERARETMTDPPVPVLGTLCLSSAQTLLSKISPILYVME